MKRVGFWENVCLCVCVFDNFCFFTTRFHTRVLIAVARRVAERPFEGKSLRVSAFHT